MPDNLLGMDTNEKNTQGRASYSGDERRELIEEFNASELTQAAFCREWNINPKTLARWLRVERKNEVTFCEVEAGTVSVPKDEVRICLPNDIEVMVPLTAGLKLGDILREAASCLV